MRHQELVFKLTRELYDAKAKLERIRWSADRAYKHDDALYIRHRIIDILNELDEGEVYED